MKINNNALDELAAVLYAYEDPDSDLPYLDPVEDKEEFDETLKAYKQNYQGLAGERKRNLRGAVAWLRSQSTDNLPELVDDLYRMIWISNNPGESEEIIDQEIDDIRYIKAMQAVLNQTPS